MLADRTQHFVIAGPGRGKPADFGRLHLLYPD